MERQDLANWLAEQFTADQWERGVSKEDLIMAARDDRALAAHFAGYPDGGLYRDPDEVIQGSAHRGWQDQRMSGPLGDDEAPAQEPVA